MKVVIGHKALNLEELFSIACLPSTTEVVIDNPTAAEFSPQPAQVQAKDKVQEYPELSPSIELRHEHERAIILVKLLQIIKMKKNCTAASANLLVRILNDNLSFLVCTI